MYYGYSQLKNEAVTFFRYPPAPEKDGLEVALPPVKMIAPGSIQQVQDLQNIRKLFGEEIMAAIKYFSAPRNELYIEEDVFVRNGVKLDPPEKRRADVIFYDDKFWRVVSTIKNTLLLPNTQSQATLMTHVPDELLEAV